MTDRRLAIALILFAAQLGCGSSSGPSPSIDPSLVGTWVAEISVSDPSGSRCTMSMRLVLSDTGGFEWNVFEPVSFADCDTRLTRTTGQWRAQDGSATFTPPPPVFGVEEPTLDLPYELTGGGFRIGFFTFEPE